MSLFSLLALTFGMVAAAAERVPRPAFALIAVSGSRRSTRQLERRPAIRAARSAERPLRIAVNQRSLRRLVEPLRGAAAARAPGFGC